MTPGKRDRATAGAKLLVLAMAFGWGFNWIAARFILQVLPPWSMRAVCLCLGSLTLYMAARFGRRPMTIARADWLKVIISGFFNVAAFGVGSAYAQIYGTTSRAIVIAYSMPIWAALLARLVLKERLTTVKLFALGLCAAGLVILILPLARDGFPFGALIALGCAWSWAAGTIYLKCVKIDAPTITVAFWQLLFGALTLAVGMLWFDGVPQLWSLPAHVMAWIAYSGFFGMGMTYFFWFTIVERLSAMTASLGSLLVPVVGVVGSAVLLRERPGASDIIGFACIFAAAASVLLQPNVKPPEMPE